MLKTRKKTLEGKTCLVSGNGNVFQHIVEKITQLRGRCITMSDSNGYIFDPEGIDQEKLAAIKELKNLRRGRIKEYVDMYSRATYTPVDSDLDQNPLWNHRADCAFPGATQNEINAKDAKNLLNNGVYAITEGANMPTTPEAIEMFIDAQILFDPGKAANASGVAVSGLQMPQTSLRLSWTKEEADERLCEIMKNIHRACVEAAEAYGTPGNYIHGANIAGFLKVAEAMLDQGLV